jgi:hypothetical protein
MGMMGRITDDVLGGAVKIAKKAKTTVNTPPTPIPNSFINRGLVDRNGNITIHHASREKWDGPFDLNRVGNRGATEGWGAYFATDMRDAKKFGKNIKELNISPETSTRFIDGMAKLDEQTPYVKDALRKVVDRIKTPDDSDIIHNASGWVKNNGNQLQRGDEVTKNIDNLRHKPKELLNYIETIEPVSYRNVVKREIVGTPDMTGDDLYRYLVNEKWGNEKKASEALRDRGIPGIITGRPDLHTTTGSPNVIVWDKDVLTFTPSKTLTKPDILKSAAALGLMGAAYPSDSEAMYVGAKPTGGVWPKGSFSSLMDKMPRREISDAAAKITVSKPTRRLGDSFFDTELGDLLQHKQLYEQYPDLKSMRVVASDNVKPYSASFNNGEIWMGADTPANSSKTSLLHEIQHAIQEKEGWARGGNPAEFAPAKMAEIKMSSLNNRIDKLWADAPDEFKNLTRKVNRKDGDYLDAISQLEKKYPKLNNEYIKLDTERFYINRDKDFMGELSPQEQYKNLAGEIESRDTSARMGMSGIERGRTAPYSSENIPLSDVIVKGINPQKLAYGVGGMGLMGMGEAQAGPTIENARQRMVQQYEGGGLEPAMNPLEYAIPGRWGGGLMNAGIDAAMNYFTGR